MANNYKMDNGSRLLNKGFEAFGMLEEEEYGRKGRPAAPSKQKAAPDTGLGCHYQYQPQQALVYQMMNPVSSSEERIICCDAMKLHDGLPIMDYPRRKSATMAY